MWTVLYFLMGAAACLVWARRAENPVGWPLALFTMQLASNLFWSVLFFGGHAPAVGLMDIVILWAPIGTHRGAFYRVRPRAGLVPAPILGMGELRRRPQRGHRRAELRGDRS